MKPGGPAVPLKVMMVFLLHLYIYFYGLTYLFLNSDWLKNLKNKQKIGTANFEYQFSKLICLFIKFELEVLVVLNIFVRERSLEPPLHLAATELNRQVMTFLQLWNLFLTQKQIVFQLLIFLFRIYYYIHTV